MTDIAQGLRTFLLADATIAGLVGARMYPTKTPQNPTTPYIRFSLQSGESFNSTDGPSGLENPVFQIDAIDTTYAGATAVADAIRLRLNGYAGDMGGVEVQGVFLVRKYDLPYDEPTELSGRSADYQIWNEEALT